MQDRNDIVMLELDRPRQLKLGHKALKRFSALTGLSMQALSDGLSHYDQIAVLIYCMLSAEDPALTVEQVDEMLEGVDLMTLIQKTGEAIAAAFDDGSEADEETPLTAAGTGSGA